ncbi:hypothetical protein POL68_26225 [Stigmatella sp. ncwal1]|uniref:HTH crp-type domain-containing protein n=1 Tax=Stigmatella ashevillensis TaxID=2995309 RepID=A0ABT5DI29_9BACT|nr:hypothetical protein [Stigmatella ashevillena]MDC0711992.1 hypothetical protein [Stigmatella ashevillena]
MSEGAMEQALGSEALGVLVDILEKPLRLIRDSSSGGFSAQRHVDLILESDQHLFLVECKSSASVRSIEAGIEQLKRERSYVSYKPALPVIAVPFMGEVGKQLCRSASVSWIDLAGNAHLRGPQLHIRIEGRPNRHRKPGRPSNVFAPKSARVTRRLLLEPTRAFRQRELAQETGLGEGFVSRIVRQLETEGLLSREQGAIRVKNPGLLLDAWREAYSFSHHHIVRGHIPARSPQILLSSLADSLRERSILYAATGPASAWLHAKFAGFRVVTIFLKDIALLSASSLLNFRPEERGSNVWMIVPDDLGVFDGAVDLEGIRCASAVQTYLDLLAMPERAQEAADELRQKRLSWSLHG